MSIFTISRVDAWEALDSRGRPTVACRLTTTDGVIGSAMAPSGASTGRHEALELRDGEDRYQGRGVRKAISSLLGVLAPAVIGRDCRDQAGLDEALAEADGTGTFSSVGANASLAVSVACARAAAGGQGLELYSWLAAPDRRASIPLPMVNVFSGGAHAGGENDLQDYLVVPLSAPDVATALEMAVAVREVAAGLIRDRGGIWALVADEGGLAAPGPANHTALEVLTQAIEQAGYEPGVDAGIAIDVAASQFAQERPQGCRYLLGKDGLDLDADAWSAILVDWVDRWPIVSLEDPLAQDDWAAWARLTAALGDRLQILGDDLFVTDLERTRRGIAQGVGNAVLVKANQTGTLSRARAVVDLAQAAGYGTVLSARSGETEESWMSDLAIGWGTGQIKVGSTTRSERTAKWNRLLEVEHLDLQSLRYAGAAAIRRTGSSQVGA